jgi:UDP:flavonoid glycosyltransferase YjiC (YdhE family)
MFSHPIKSSQPINIDLVAPPFAGHLFPLLSLGKYLQDSGVVGVRVLSTSKAQEAIGASGLEGVILIPTKDQQIADIADPPYRVKHNPRFLLRQLEGNLSLMTQFRDELAAVWQQAKPDLVLADFTVPVAGLLAQEMSVPWWTSLPTPCALESRRGTPSYLGGWTPGDSALHKTRDMFGRALIRTFKQLVAWRYRAVLRSLGLTALYRPHGEEAIYSPTKILALGIKEFEFEQDWPTALQFIGPITASPPFSHAPPQLEPSQQHVLVSLGTHIPWAKEQAVTFIKTLAAQMPDINFHFSYGRVNEHQVQRLNNLWLHSYIPYDYLDLYDAAIIHGGTGVTYSCLKAGVPVLVWPHDYDQFDHAARIVKHGLGFRIHGHVNETAWLLHKILVDTKVQEQTQWFKERLGAYNAYDFVLQEVLETFKLSSRRASDPK